MDHYDLSTQKISHRYLDKTTSFNVKLYLTELLLLTHPNTSNKDIFIKEYTQDALNTYVDKTNTTKGFSSFLINLIIRDILLNSITLPKKERKRLRKRLAEA